MRRQKRAVRSHLDYCKFEERICLTVNAVVTPTGSLSVNGVADGQVEIIAQGNQQFLVTDDGVDVATLNGVNQNIVVKLNLLPADDSVQISLFDETLRNVVVELGDGNNDLLITGNSSITRLIYRGGSGADSAFASISTERMTAFIGGDGENQFTAEHNSGRFRYRGGADADTVTFGSILSPGTFQAEYVGVVLGDGVNEFASYLSVSENQYVRGGEQQDRITSFNVNGTASYPMGNGNNLLSLVGDHGRLFVRGGFDADAVVFDPNSSVAQRVGIILWGGDDFVRVDGQINTDFYWNSTDGDDQVFVNSSAVIAGNFTALLGGDFNRFTHNGLIRGDLYVASHNLADNYAIGGTVLGNIRLRPGGQGGGG